MTKMQFNGSEIHIHGLWRTTSTWWWHQLRKNQKNRAYFEPFHEYLSFRTIKQCEVSHGLKSKADTFRHPNTSTHYFAEYPLRESGGVDLYDTRFALEEFETHDSGLMQSHLDYLNLLREHALQYDRTPCFKFNRSIARAYAIKRAIGGFHIYLMRDPVAIYRSSMSFVSDYNGGPGSYFITCPLMIIGLNRSSPTFDELSNLLGIGECQRSSFQDQFSYFDKLSKSMSAQQHFDVTSFFWAMGLSCALKYADLVVDIDQFATDRVYRRIVETKLALDGDFEIDGNGFSLLMTEETYEVSNDVREIIGRLFGDALSIAIDSGVTKSLKQKAFLTSIL